ncbi:MAG: protein kinase [Planctomycetes bacterium]|nr:protein kinase [Planctomycetota bacterium]
MAAEGDGAGGEKRRCSACGEELVEGRCPRCAGKPTARIQGGRPPVPVLVAETPDKDTGAPGRISRYVVEKELGRGGMGVVYLARDPALDRQVALKVLTGSSSVGRGRERFRLEAEAAGGLTHANIVSIHDFGEYRSTYFYTMDYIRGHTLEDEAAKGLTPFRSAQIIEQVARAVDYAHQRGVIHRDLKPGNIFIDENDVVKVMDFGLAKITESPGDESRRGSGSKMRLTEEGIVIGTPMYMSPEQASGRSEAVDERTDVYALGAILYELFTGSPPFRSENQYELLSMIIQDHVVQPSRKGARIQPDLETICMKCLEKDPWRRYQTAGELADDLKSYLDGEPIKARPVGPVTRVMRRVKRHRNVIAAALAGLLAAGGIYVYLSTRIRRMEESSEERRRFTWQTAYEEKFDGEGVPAAWIPGRGRWWTDGGALHGTGDGNTYITMKSQVPGDLRVELTATLQGGELAVAILGTEESPIDGGYFLSLRTGASKVCRMGATVLADSSISLEAGVPYRIIAERLGSVVRVYLAERPEVGMEFDDPVPIGGREHGAVGIYTYSGSVSVEDVKVSRVSWPEETSPLVLAQKLLSRGEYDLAVEEFVDIALTSRDPDIAAQGLFWAAKSVEMSGALPVAAGYYAELRRHPAVDMFPEIKEEALFRAIRCHLAVGRDDLAAPLLAQAEKDYPRADSWKILAVYAMNEAAASRAKVQATMKSLTVEEAGKMRMQLSHSPPFVPWLVKAEGYIDRVADAGLAVAMKRALARTYMEMGGDAGSIEHALELDPENPLYLVRYTQIQLNQGNVERARALAEKAVAVAPGSKEPYEALAAVAQRKGDYAGAAGYLAKALELDPYSRGIRWQLGNALILGGRPEEAAQTAKGDAEEGDQAAVKLYVYALMEMGRLEDARRFFRDNLAGLLTLQPSAEEMTVYEGWPALMLQGIEIYLATEDGAEKGGLLQDLRSLARRMEQVSERRELILGTLDRLESGEISEIAKDVNLVIPLLDDFDFARLQRRYGVTVERERH